MTLIGFGLGERDQFMLGPPFFRSLSFGPRRSIIVIVRCRVTAPYSDTTAIDFDIVFFRGIRADPDKVDLKRPKKSCPIALLLAIGHGSGGEVLYNDSNEQRIAKFKFLDCDRRPGVASRHPT